jgi:hypothetical protein
MKNKHITLTIDDDTTFINKINVDISQDSSIFFIFYFFYNANILKLLKRSRYKIIVIEFMNDINILIYEMNTKNNCETLKKLTLNANYEQDDMKHASRQLNMK